MLVPAFFDIFRLIANNNWIVEISLYGITVELFEIACAQDIDQLLRRGAYSMGSREVIPSITLWNLTAQFAGSLPEIPGEVDINWKIAKHYISPTVIDSRRYFPLSIFNIKEQNS